MKKQLESLGFPIAYRNFAENSNPTLPFITYYVEGIESFSADGITYTKNDEVKIELYTDGKDLYAEKTVEDFLTNKKFFYEKNETYITSEKMNLITFEITI